MTKKKFDNYKFSNKTEIKSPLYYFSGTWVKICAVDFEHRTVDIDFVNNVDYKQIGAIRK